MTVFICHNYTDDSFASGSKYLAEYLSAKDHTVVFLSHRPRGLKAFQSGNLTVIPWPVKRRPTDLKSAFFFTRLLFRYKPDCIIGHFGGAVISSVLSKLFSLGHVKVYNVYHTLAWQNTLDNKNSKLHTFLQKTRRKLFYRFFVDEIIAPSKSAKTDYLANWPAKPVHLVYNGYKTANINKDTRNAYDGKVLLFLGRLDNSKGIRQLLDGFQQYTVANPATQLKLRLVGEAQSELLRHISKGSISYEGVATYDRVPGIIADAYFMIAPSLMDNLPTVGIEAFSYHTPVVASGRGGWPEIVDNNVNGLIIEPTIEGIVTALEHLDKLTWEEYQSYCTNSRKKYDAYFTPSHYALAIEKLLIPSGN